MCAKLARSAVPGEKESVILLGPFLFMPNSPASSHRLRGVFAACGAYFLWGLFPIYWKQLQAIEATELIAHRIVWSLVFVLGLTSLLGTWGELRPVLSSKKLIGRHLLSGFCVSVNWLTYVWGVNHGYVLESSLGYYLSPLVNVALGRFVLGERLSSLKWTALGVAFVGVAVQLSFSDHLPWIALVLASSWGAYGLLRKHSPLGSLAGLTLETALLSPFASAYLLVLAWQGGGALGHAPLVAQVLVLCAGAVTAIPLLLFALGVRRLTLSTIGFLQYLVPTMTFLLGVLLYKEPLDFGRTLAFVFIWGAVALFIWDNWKANKTPSV